MKTIRIYIVEQDGTASIADLNSLKEFGLDTEEAVAAAFGDTGTWHEFKLRPATYGKQLEIEKKSLVPDEAVGFRQDPLKLPGARAEVMIETWTLDKPLTGEGFEDLPPLVAAYIDHAVQNYLYPSLGSNPDFFAWFKSRSTSSKESEKA